MARAEPGDLIVVTGANSGIGSATTRLLLERGYLVAGGHRDPADADPLRTAGAIPFVIDVTRPETLEATAAAVAGLGHRVAGLINNAGIAVGAPIELVPLDDLRRQLEVNVVGLVASTQAFLGLVRAGRGRIVNMSSVSGIRSAPIIGPYAASKYAVEAVSDALRMELASEDIQVVLIESGGVKTPIWEKSVSGGSALLADPRAARYRRHTESAMRTARHAADHGLPAGAVADAVLRALESSRPRTRYPLGKRVRLQSVLARVLPDRAFDALRLRVMGIRKTSGSE